MVIGICGGSGSGKTSFIKEIRNMFSLDEVCILSQDDYYKERTSQKADSNGVLNFDLPSSIDKKAFYEDLTKLIDFKTVNKKEYTFNNDDVEPKVLVFKPAPVIIVEGLFIFKFKKIFNLTDVKVFIHAKENLKVIRRIHRDQVERNYPISDVLYRYQHHVLPSFEKYILPYKEEADLVINNNDNYHIGLKVLEGYIANYLEKNSGS